jgi:polar amino acid transport system permease protein
MNWDRVWTYDNLRRLLIGDLPGGEVGGLLLSLTIALLAIFGSTVLGAIVGIMRTSRIAAVRMPATVYVQTLRNIPLVILVFWAYFVPPHFGWQTSKFASVLVALIMFTSAYLAENVKSGILSIPHSQTEAARSLGLSVWHLWIWVILPQSFHKMVPAITGRYIAVIKNTSLAFLIGLADLTEIGKQINNRLMSSPIEVYLTLLLLYFIVNSGLSRLMRRLEDLRRFNSLFIRGI